MSEQIVRTVEEYEALPDGTILQVLEVDSSDDGWLPGDVFVRGSDYWVGVKAARVVELGGTQ